jgi:hypothetical protein
MALEYTNRFHPKALQTLPKLGFLVWKYMFHLATLLYTGEGMQSNNRVHRKPIVYPCFRYGLKPILKQLEALRVRIQKPST